MHIGVVLSLAVFCAGGTQFNLLVSTMSVEFHTVPHRGLNFPIQLVIGSWAEHPCVGSYFLTECCPHLPCGDEILQYNTSSAVPGVLGIAPVIRPL